MLTPPDAPALLKTAKILGQKRPVQQRTTRIQISHGVRLLCFQMLRSKEQARECAPDLEPRGNYRGAVIEQNHPPSGADRNRTHLLRTGAPGTAGRKARARARGLRPQSGGVGHSAMWSIPTAWTCLPRHGHLSTSWSLCSKSSKPIRRKQTDLPAPRACLTDRRSRRITGQTGSEGSPSTVPALYRFGRPAT
jgi:hypothetical protein